MFCSIIKWVTTVWVPIVMMRWIFPERRQIIFSLKFNLIYMSSAKIHIKCGQNTKSKWHCVIRVITTWKNDRFSPCHPDDWLRSSPNVVIPCNRLSSTCHPTLSSALSSARHPAVSSDDQKNLSSILTKWRADDRSVSSV